MSDPLSDSHKCRVHHPRCAARSNAPIRPIESGHLRSGQVGPLTVLPAGSGISWHMVGGRVDSCRRWWGWVGNLSGNRPVSGSKGWKERWCKRSTRAILNRASYLLYVSLYMCGLFRNGGKYGHNGADLKFFLVLTSSTPPEVGINLSGECFIYLLVSAARRERGALCVY